MSKLAFLAAATLLAAGSTAQADERIPAGAMPPAAVIHQMVADGYDLRRLEVENGRYEARVRTTEGKLVELAVDPATGKPSAPEAVSARNLKDAGPAVPTTAADAISLAATEGHYDVRELEFRNGKYQIEARDDAGAGARIEVDAQTGQIARLVHEAR